MGESTIAIVGGGITGLAAALTIERARQSGAPVRCTLLEASDRLGGIIRTERADDFLIDAGPESFVSSKPHAAELCRALGLGARLIEPIRENRKVYIVHRGALVSLPAGLVLAVPTGVRSTLATPLLSIRGKLRLLGDLVLPRRRSHGDESIASFVRRRLGQEALEVFGEPLLAGIYAGDAERLSVQATFPQFVAMEQRYGSLIRGATIQRRSRTRAEMDSKSAPVFLTLRSGMYELVDAIRNALPTASIRMQQLVNGVEPTAKRWKLRVAGGPDVTADRVLLAAPIDVTAKWLRAFDAPAGDLLGQTLSIGSATVFLAWARHEVPHALDATGFLVPRREGMELTGSTWVTSKWEGRAPQGMVLLRAFIGGARSPGAAERSDKALIDVAREELGRLLGVRAQPKLERVYRYLRANPQPEVGHGERIAAIEARMQSWPGIAIAGGGYSGWGIPDCIKQGQAAAERLLLDLS